MSKKQILCSVGTRPEVIKMAPVIHALRKTSWAQCRVLATAQHRDLLDQLMDLFEIKPDIDLDIMQRNQRLGTLTARLIEQLDETIARERPDLVLAQGDTTTVFCTALVCHYHRIAFGHVEAGLRSFDKYYPFPEEMNRKLAGVLTDIHFAPTEGGRANLLAEGVDDATIHVTGNTVIDALLDTAKCDPPLPRGVRKNARLVLVTAHRRENFGEPLREICGAIRELADRYEDIQFLYPVHPNPNVKTVVREMLSKHPRIVLCKPLDYLHFVAAMKQATLILTDSGGVQEEAPALGKPVLVLRDETERPEAVESGAVKLVGPHRKRIVEEADRLLTNTRAYRRMARPVFPYGDGHASERIVKAIARFLGVKSGSRKKGA